MKRLFFLSLLILNACATQQGLQQGDLFSGDTGERRVMIMPMDVQVSLLTAGGLQEPNVEWTEQAEAGLNAALLSQARARGLTLVPYGQPDAFSDDFALHNEIRALHGAVGNAILVHKYGAVPLPTKTDVFDWSLGPSVQTLAEQNDADYAMFLFARDSFSSGGRVALQLAAAIIGVGVTGGQQVAFVSLVDLKTGDVSWFNFNFQTTGDIRTPDGAATLVKKLIDDLPMSGDEQNVTSR